MRLLVSVADADDAAAARLGGADIIDAKDPLAGALGAVSVLRFREIHAAVAGAAPVSAALGDAHDDRAVASLAHAFAACGASFVKVGFAGVASRTRATTLLRAAVLGARDGASITAGGRCEVIAVAYADDEDAAWRARIGEMAMQAGASGVLIDTMHKSGPGLRALIADGAVAEWARAMRSCGLTAALAGRLTADDLPFARAAGADIAGVRGAACEGGRAGRVSPARVQDLRQRCGGPPRASGAAGAPAGCSPYVREPGQQRPGPLSTRW